jgi:predicted ATPase
MPTFLRSISATAGFLEKCRVEFAPGLTCIIGARGTCKSTIIESVRFAFNAQESRVTALIAEDGQRSPSAEPWRGLIRATLGAGSVRCDMSVVSDADKSNQVLEREVGGEPRLLQDGVRERARRDVCPDIEIFSQGDLQRIADDRSDELRLELIDRPNGARIRTLREDREALGRTLLRIGPRLRELRAQIADLTREAQLVPGIRTELQQAQERAPTSSPELASEEVKYLQRERVIESMEAAIIVRDTVIEQCDDLAEQTRRAAEIAAAVGAQTGIDVTVARDAIAQVERGLAALAQAEAQLTAVDLRSALARASEQYEHDNEAYHQLRQREQAVNESLKQRHHLQRQLNDLERRAAELRKAEDEEQALLRQRAVTREAMQENDNEVYALRIREVDAINAEHGDIVQLTLEMGTGAPAYRDQIMELLSGSRIRAQDEVATALANTFPPAALLDLAESANAQQLADVLQRDVGQMSRVLAHLADHQNLYSLEAEPPATRLGITLYDNGEAKPVETLSKGQKATALLPLILRPLPYPLLFDQPEDDLDNKFIFHSLIQTVRTLKQRRQLIFVTHNANIPVLGEADQVVVMRMRSPVLADAPLAGTVEERKQEILDLLEGGAAAFRQREAQYGDLLSGPEAG